MRWLNHLAVVDLVVADRVDLAVADRVDQEVEASLADDLL